MAVAVAVAVVVAVAVAVLIPSKPRQEISTIPSPSPSLCFCLYLSLCPRQSIYPLSQSAQNHRRDCCHLDGLAQQSASQPQTRALHLFPALILIAAAATQASQQVKEGSNERGHHTQRRACQSTRRRG